METELETASTTEPESKTNWGALILTVLIFLWLVGVTIIVHWTGWLVEQFFIAGGLNWGGWTWFFLSLSLGFVLLLPFILTPFVWKHDRYRAVFQSWLLAIGYLFLLAPIRVVNPLNTQLANLLQIALNGLFIIALTIYGRRRGKISRRRPALNQLAITLLAATILFYPWLIWGALGSPLDTILNLLSSILFGLAVGLILLSVLMPAFPVKDGRCIRDVLSTGLVTAVLLLVMGTSLGFNGLQLLLMLILPGLGWASVVLLYPDENGRPKGLAGVSLFIGLAAAGPAVFIDPDEFSIILGLGQRDLLTWALLAASIVMLLSLGASLSAVGLKVVLNRSLPRPLILIFLALFGIGGLILFFLIGQPGFHGEQLFVIMADQADLTTAETITNYDERRRFVYDTLVAQANGSQSEIRASLDRLGINYTPYYLVNAIAVDGGPIVRFWLERQPEVDRILDNPILRPLPAIAESTTGTISSPTSVPMWNQSAIGADKVWSEFNVTGQGIVIGQSDSGVQGNHPELVDSYRGRESGDDYNWLDPWYDTTAPTDIGGHGTHTLGSIVGRNTGIAPGAEWFGCVNLARNLANPALYLDCLQYMLAPYPAGGDPFSDGDPLRSAHVLNNSWGCPPLEGCDPGSLEAAVSALRAAGIFVVVSTGNSGLGGCGTVMDPLAIYDEVFSVGAVDEAGNLADFSSLGPVTVDGSSRIKPDIVAPGVDVLSAYPNSSYEYASGTSMAGPHVVGVVALIWSANPALIGRIDETEAILIESARPYSGFVPDCVDGRNLPNNGSGYGLVDAYAAVQMALDQAP